MRMNSSACDGFTLIELIVSIAISSIIVGMIALVMGAPADQYLQQSMHNELVEASERTTQTLTTDLNAALPNSVRIGNYANTEVLQMLAVTDVVYYQDETVAPTANAGLRIGAADNRFDAYGRFSQRPVWLVVNHELQPGRNAYAGTDVITPASINVPLNAWGTTNVLLAPAVQFNSPSPTNRMFAVSGPITYVCNRTTGILRRFSSHAIAPAMPVDETAPQLNTPGTVTETVATGISACSLRCTTVVGSSACARTVSFTMTVTRGAVADPQFIQIMQQFAVENLP